MYKTAKILAAILLLLLVYGLYFISRNFSAAEGERASYAALQADALESTIPKNVKWRIIKHSDGRVVIAINGFPANGSGYTGNYRYMFILANGSSSGVPIYLGKFTRLAIRCVEIRKLEVDAGGLDPSVKEVFRSLCL